MADLVALGAIRSLGASVRVDGDGKVSFPGSPGGQVVFFNASLGSATVQGDLFGLPLFVDVRIIPYRKDILRDVLNAGVPRSQRVGSTEFLTEDDLTSGRWTIDDFRHLLGATRRHIVAAGSKELRLLGQTRPTENALILGYAASPSLLHFAFGFAASAAGGEPFLDHEGGLRTDDAVIAGWRTWFGMAEFAPPPYRMGGGMPGAIDSPDFTVDRSGFYKGASVFAMGGPWFWRDMCAPDVRGSRVTRANCERDLSSRLGFALFPRFRPDQPAFHFVGGGNLGIPGFRTSGEVDATVEFLRCFYSSGADARLAAVFSWLPARRDAVLEFDRAAGSDEPDAPAALPQHLREVVIRAIEQGRTYPVTPRFGSRIEPLLIGFVRGVWEVIAEDPANPDHIDRVLASIPWRLELLRREVDVAIDRHQ